MFHSKLVSLRRQQGSMLILGIFILTVMFLLAATLITISRNGDAAINQEVLGARALFAANSGADAALAALYPVASNSGSCTAVDDTWTIPNAATTIASCNVMRTCTEFSVGTSPNRITQFRITSKAICGVDANRVSREVEVLSRAE